MTTKQQLTYFRTLLNYNRQTGVFKWKVARRSYTGKIKRGSIAGTVVRDTPTGRIQIGIDGKCYRAHQLAWLFMTGKWPPKGIDVDHEDGNGQNNSWTNLRLASRSQNNANRHKLSSSNKSGKAGVSWVANCNQWLSRINVDGKPIHLGMFDRDKLDEAITIRRAAELRYWGKHATTENVMVAVSAKRLKALPNERPAPKLDSRNKSGKSGVS
ncbi:MAG: HNH endonuclease signature motif containing protein, partial [Terriglobia bacterium]|nr:HNH endonuclease signature motif containing protein [Terriglobia bacterium]